MCVICLNSPICNFQEKMNSTFHIISQNPDYPTSTKIQQYIFEEIKMFYRDHEFHDHEFHDITFMSYFFPETTDFPTESYLCEAF